MAKIAEIQAHIEEARPPGEVAIMPMQQSVQAEGEQDQSNEHQPQA